MPISLSPCRQMVVILAVLSPVMQAHADAPSTTRTLIASVDPTPKGVGVAPAPATVPALGTLSPIPLWPVAPPLPKPRPEDAKILLATLRNQKTCKIRLDLTVENATLEEIAVRVQKLLPPTAPKIEVRDARPVRLSFALKNSTVGEVLEAASAIAEAKLWVLPDRLLLAPETALPKADGTNNLSPGMVPTLSDRGRNTTQRVFASLIADELVAKLASDAQGTVQGTGLLPSVKTTFDKLSPEAQEMLRSLVDHMSDLNADRAAITPGTSRLLMNFTLAPTTVVQLNPSGHRAEFMGRAEDILKVSEGMHWFMDWSTDGVVSSSGGGTSLSSKPGPTPPPLFDPSANKS